MTAIPRAFVAVVPPAAVLDAIDAHVATAAELHTGPTTGWRTSRREQWHLTLEFLGPLDDDAEETDRLATIAAGLPPFDLRIGGAGAFPRPDRARVLWLGVAAGARELGGLAALVRRVDADPYHPHLTVARAARPRDATELIASLDVPGVGPPWTVEAIELIASTTHPSGAHHTTLGRLPLGSGAP